MPPAIAPLPRSRSARHTTPVRPRSWAAAVALGVAVSAGARAEAPPPPPESTTVALLTAPGGAATREPRATPVPKPHASGSPTSHDGSHIPTPIDNPWALGLLAALVARMVWMDRSPGRDKS